MPTPNDPGPAAPAEIVTSATDGPAPSGRGRRARLKKWFRKYRNPTRWALGVFTLTATALIAVIGLGIFWLAWTQLAPPDNDPDADRPAASFDIARSSVTLLGVLTVGGAAAVAYRRQIHLEKQTKREERQTKLAIAKERRAKRADLHARYQQAAAMLADSKPLIRIAGAYALEALAVEWATVKRNNVQRDVCIDLLCGYLRSTTGVTPATEDSWAVIADDEKGVRDTIATVIGRHLRVGGYSREPGDWSDRRYDFTDAHFNHVNFRETTFQGPAYFGGAAFHQVADFGGATFQQDAEFNRATFQRDASFSGATFQRDASFSDATFQRDASFSGATFQNYAGFDSAAFQQDARFNGATFQDAGFSGATFQQNGRFNNATFGQPTSFDETVFMCGAFFTDATFRNNTTFGGTDFGGTTSYSGATFDAQLSFSFANFRQHACLAEAHFLGVVGINQVQGYSPCLCDTHVRADVLGQHPELAADLLKRGVAPQRRDTTCPKCRAALDRIATA